MAFSPVAAANSGSRFVPPRMTPGAICRVLERRSTQMHGHAQCRKKRDLKYERWAPISVAIDDLEFRLP